MKECSRFFDGLAECYADDSDGDVLAETETSSQPGRVRQILFEEWEAQRQRPSKATLLRSEHLNFQDSESLT